MVYIDIDSPAGRRIPIAIPEFTINSVQGSSSRAAKRAKLDIMDALSGDLDFSGHFDVIEKTAYIEKSEPAGGTNFSNWRLISAELLIKGSISVVGEDLTVEIRLFDVVKEKQLTGTRFMGKIQNPRIIAHRFADEIIKELTGALGIFSTRIMFIANRSDGKEIFMSDYDGRNLKQITHNGSINLSPQWSPDGRKVLYTSYKNGRPALYVRNISNSKERKVSDKPGINIAGRWGPRGDKIALTLSINKNPELYTLDLNTNIYTRLTRNGGIDTSPTWSPDGRRLAYVSDIAGNPHIYMINSTGGKPKRLTYEGKYNTTPSWSPNGKWITFSRLRNGKFSIWVMRPDGMSQKRLTYEGNNENPSWSPDSRYIIFSTTDRKFRTSLYMIRADGTGLRRVPSGLGTEKSPSWSPFFKY
ncbi:MAG: Tol-Pal system beta propeller repeat protein TolB [Thermodesulfobacteriota bacterium]